MLLAIDVGNTHTVYGVWDGDRWRQTWRRGTDPRHTEDEIAAWLAELVRLAGLPFQVHAAVCASVVPGVNDVLSRLARKHLGCELLFLSHDLDVGLSIAYDPPRAVGADRIANALGALARWQPPIVVVDFGTATTFDAISRDGIYLGGAILPGVEVSAQALVGHTAKLPQIEYRAPEQAIGRTTVESLQSGIVLGYAGAIDALADRISKELGGARIVATGGLGSLFMGLCKSIEEYAPTLTLDGLVLAWQRAAEPKSSGPRMV
jgi:type III pantothenate kinase